MDEMAVGFVDPLCAGIVLCDQFLNQERVPSMSDFIEFFMSDEAARLRMIERKPIVVVHAEVGNGVFVELDADDLDHGHRLAASWTKNVAHCISAAVRVVRKDGKLSRVDGRIHSKQDHLPLPFPEM